VKVGMAESQYDQLHWPNCHISCPLSRDPLASFDTQQAGRPKNEPPNDPIWTST
jgi:hypothetical protein